MNWIEPQNTFPKNIFKTLIYTLKKLTKLETNTEKFTSSHIIVKVLKDKEKILKTAKEK